MSAISAHQKSGFKSIFSIDVEDWFNISQQGVEPDFSQWDNLPSCVEKNFSRMLEILSQFDIRATCFFIGYFAQRFPMLVRRASECGHEVASHGYAHRLVFTQTPDEFYADVRRTRLLLEDILGRPVHGYRAAAFSVTDKTPWFFEKLIEGGYKYDSSVFPAPHRIGGLKTDKLHPHRVKTAAGEIVEFPITAVKVMGKLMCFFGGGYLRLFPYWLIRSMAHRVLEEGRPVIFYIHPREIDPNHPRLPMGWKDRFKTYVNLRTTEPKLCSILRDFGVSTFQNYLNENKPLPLS